MNGRFAELWEQVAKHGAEGMVLLGDTPYIDSTQIIHQRIKHRTFLLQDGPASLSKKIPFWGTWDDHDFGANDSDGGIHNRVHTRRVFKEYRSLLSYGENEEGIYTHFRRGPVEVFLLDTRYFAGTEESFAAANKPTLIGRTQWTWLQRVLKASTAPVKVLACGMTWDAKLPVTTTHADAWDRYAYEREAIIDFLGKERIPGAFLVGGDIHCTQVMKYATESRIGYPLYHVVTSPMHERVIRDNEALTHPGMLFNRAEPNTFLKLTADTRVEPTILTAEIIDITGQSIYRLVIGGE
jgi:alkaline phosphatase D